MIRDGSYIIRFSILSHTICTIDRIVKKFTAKSWPLHSAFTRRAPYVRVLFSSCFVLLFKTCRTLGNRVILGATWPNISNCIYRFNRAVRNVRFSDTYNVIYVVCTKTTYTSMFMMRRLMSEQY